jgi:anti-sigma factor RsiW
MNDKLHNDDVLFDRLVDGELSRDERRVLLESLNARPQGWRRCAMAFLEAQSWRRELRQLAEERPAGAATVKTPVSQSQSKRNSVRTAAQWLAVAAGLLLAFKIGAWQRERGMPIASSPAATNEQLVSVPPPAAVPNNAKTSDALNLWVRDDAGQLRRVRVPLVDAQTLDQQLGTVFQTGVPDDVRDRLNDSGYAVESKRQYAPLWLENGRPMVVPVEDTKIVPVSNRAY